MSDDDAALDEPEQPEPEPEPQPAAEPETTGGELIDEALVNSWVVGVQYVNPADPDGPEGPEGPPAG